MNQAEILGQFTSVAAPPCCCEKLAVFEATAKGRIRLKCRVCHKCWQKESEWQRHRKILVLIAHRLIWCNIWMQCKWTCLCSVMLQTGCRALRLPSTPQWNNLKLAVLLQTTADWILWHIEIYRFRPAVGDSLALEPLCVEAGTHSQLCVRFIPYFLSLTVKKRSLLLFDLKYLRFQIFPGS